jgi:hypothetical protein
MTPLPTSGDAGSSGRTALNARRVSVGQKLREWLGRYGLAECVGVACALLASFIARRVSGNAVAAAYAGAWGETVGYAGTIVVRDFLAETRTRGRKSSRIVADLAAEFGPSGILDTMLVRPLAMGLGAKWFGSPRGLIVGKLAADVLFYIPVVFMYERRKARR